MERAPRFNSEHRSLALFALTLGVFLVTLNVTVVVVALPSLQADLQHAGSDQAAWVIDAYNLVGASLLLSAGFLADRFGRKRMLCTGYALFTIGALACALAPSGGSLIAFRVRAGARRHGAHADEPLDRRQPLSRAARARPCDRPLGRLVGPRHGPRADRRRRAHRVARAGARCSRSNAIAGRDRARDRAAGRAALAQRDRAAHRRRRAGARDGLPGDAHLRADRGAALRLHLGAHHRRSRRSPSCCSSRSSSSSCASTSPSSTSGSSAIASSRAPIFLARRDVLHVRRVHLPQRALPAGRARLLGARRGRS